jgi:hypothetical protein
MFSPLPTRGSDNGPAALSTHQPCFDAGTINGTDTVVASLCRYAGQGEGWIAFKHTRHHASACRWRGHQHALPDRRRRDPPAPLAARRFASCADGNAASAGLEDDAIRAAAAAAAAQTKADAARAAAAAGAAGAATAAAATTKDDAARSAAAAAAAATARLTRPKRRPKTTRPVPRLQPTGAGDA